MATTSSTDMSTIGILRFILFSPSSKDLGFPSRPFFRGESGATHQVWPTVCLTVRVIRRSAECRHPLYLSSCRKTSKFISTHRCAYVRYHWAGSSSREVSRTWIVRGLAADSDPVPIETSARRPRALHRQGTDRQVLNSVPDGLEQGDVVRSSPATLPGRHLAQFGPCLRPRNPALPEGNHQVTRLG